MVNYLWDALLVVLMVVPWDALLAVSMAEMMAAELVV